MNQIVRWPIALLMLVLMAGCSVNPVTGQRNLNMMGEDWELQVGQQQYVPLRQQQGGDFNLDPELVAYVQRVGQRVAAVSDRELPYEFEIINDSVPNAWALPGGKITINRGLLTEMQTEAELAAVLGHEIVHSAAGHSAQQQSRASIMQGAVVLGSIAVGAATEDAGYASATMLGGSLGAQLITQGYSRENEREADKYGMVYAHRAGYSPRGAVDLMETFVRLSEGRHASSIERWFSTHPPSQERVQNNLATLAELGDEGEIGRERYQRMVARLERAEPAYEAFDEGRQALANDNSALALQKAEEAIRIESGEALFHGLKGDALATQSNFEQAERAYSQALRHNDSWFYHHLRRGMVREELGKLDGARQDLTQSNQLLPTATGFYFLGNIERAAGNRAVALEHYRIAAQSQSQIGERAKLALQEMGAG